jgi:hypothetical protein
VASNINLGTEANWIRWQWFKLSTGGTFDWTFDTLRADISSDTTPIERLGPATPVVSRVAVTTAATNAPAAVTAFTPTLPTHTSGDRLILAVVGKYDTTTIPTINQSWTLLKSGTGGTGSTGNDAGQTFWAVYGIDATSSSMTAPTVTPGATAPNSWTWVAASYRPYTGYTWADAIGTSAAWVQSASDTSTASPLTGTAGAFTGVQPTGGDAIFAVGVIPTDLGSALGATTLTATGLSGGTVTAATTQYTENTLGQDSAAVWADWTGFTGTASAGVAASFTITSSTNHSGSIVAVALRQTLAATVVNVSGSGTLTFSGVPKPARTVPLTGAGTLTFSGVPKPAATRTLSGSGTLSFTGVPKPAGAITLSGSGTLTLSGVPKPARTVPLSGSGTLSFGGVPKPARTVPLSGAGTLSFTRTITTSGSVSLAGAGILGFGVTEFETEGSVSLSGSGSLSFSGAPALPSTRTLSGSGSLTFGEALTTTNLLLRYRADDISGADLSSVSSWPSAISGEPAAIQNTSNNQPKLRVGVSALNGHNTVEFDGSNDMLALTGSALDVARNKSNLIVFIVYKLPGSAVANTRSLFTLSTGTTTGARAGILQNSSNVHQISGRRLDTDSFGSASSASGSTTGELAVLTGIWRWSTSDVFLFKNGTQVASSLSFQTTGTTSNTASLTGFIGANAAGTAEWFSGQIAEILAYDSADLDGSLRANVHTYLKNTYGVSSSDYVSSDFDIAQSLPLAGSGTLSFARTITTSGSVSLSGAGSLIFGEVLNFAGSVSLSGAGTLSLNGVPKPVATVALSGSGTLSPVGVTTAAGSINLSGSGSLTLGATPKPTGAVPLSGSGTLSFGATPKPAGSSALSGSGSLTLGATPKPTGLLSLAGAGTLSLTGAQTVLGTLTLAGSGTLSVAGVPKPVGSVSLSGAGTLGIGRTITASGTLPLSGIGVLSFTRTVAITGPVILSGIGTLSGGSVLTISGDVDLDGSGTLSSSTEYSAVGGASLSGTGTLSFGRNIGVVGPAALSGTGTLSSFATLHKSGTLTLSGIGSLVPLAGVPSAAGTLTLSGSGSLSLTGSSVSASSTFLTGTGSLSFVPTVQVSRVSALSGSGQLSFTGQTAYSGELVLSGSGGLASVGVSTNAGTATLSSTGSLSLLTTPHAAGLLALSGSGQVSFLAANQYGGGFVGSGAGTLSTAAVLAYSVFFGLSGVGTLYTSEYLLENYAGVIDLFGDGELAASAQIFFAPVSFSGKGLLDGEGEITQSGEILVHVDHPVAPAFITITMTSSVPDLEWVQISGPEVELNVSGSQCSFVSPAVRGLSTLTFSVSDGINTDTVSVQINLHPWWAPIAGVEVPMRVVAV